MKLEFGKYTKCTKLANKIDEEFFKQYEAVLICPDVQNFWVAKILVGWNEDYEQEEGAVLIERNNIDDYSARHLKPYDHDAIAKKVLKLDSEDGSNWDMLACESVKDAYEQLADIFGINEEEG